MPRMRSTSNCLPAMVIIPDAIRHFGKRVIEDEERHQISQNVAGIVEIHMSCALVALKYIEAGAPGLSCVLSPSILGVCHRAIIVSSALACASSTRQLSYHGPPTSPHSCRAQRTSAALTSPP